MTSVFSGISLEPKQAGSRQQSEKQQTSQNNKQPTSLINKQTNSQGGRGGIAIKRKPVESSGAPGEQSREKIQKLLEPSPGGRQPKTGERREERQKEEASLGRRGPAVKREALEVAPQDAKRQQLLQKSVKVKSEEVEGAQQKNGETTYASPKSPISVRKDLMSQNPGEEKRKQTMHQPQQQQQQHQPQQQQQHSEVVVKKEPEDDMLAAVDALLSENQAAPASQKIPNPQRIPNNVAQYKAAMMTNNVPAMQVKVPPLSSETNVNVPLISMSASQVATLQRQFEVNQIFKMASVSLSNRMMMIIMMKSIILFVLSM